MQAFHEWVQQRQQPGIVVVAEIDRIARTLIQAGAAGVSYAQLSATSSIDPGTLTLVLDELFAGTGFAAATGTGGNRRYRYAGVVETTKPDSQRWCEHRRRPGPIVSEVDRVLHWIHLAGASGIGYQELAHGSHLERPVLQRLLDALVRLGMVRALGAGLDSKFFYSCRF